MKKKGSEKKSEPAVQVTVITRILGDAPDKTEFVLGDGRKLKNLFELVDELEKMSDEAFARYVNAARNDFANWIKDIFRDEVLAQEIKRAAHKFDAQRILLKRLLKEMLSKAKIK